MAIDTLEKVNDQLKESNKKLKTIKDLTVDSLDYQLLTVEAIEKGFSKLTDFMKGNSLLQIEKDRERSEYEKDTLETFKEMAKKSNVPRDQARMDSKNMLVWLGNLQRIGVFAGILAVSLGTVAGAISSYVKNLMVIGKGISYLVKLFAPSNLLKTIGDSIAKIKSIFTISASSIDSVFTKSFGKIVTFFKTMGDVFLGFSLRSKVFKEAITGITRFMRGVTDFSNYVLKFGDKFNDITRMFNKFSKSFSKVFGGVFKVVSKIFAPIITVFTTIMGAWEGFKAEGIIGLLKGVITGFFDGFILGFLDVVKDIGAWVLGALGFDKAEKFLDSFSFNDLFKGFIDGIFGAVSDIFTGIIESFKGIGNSLSTAVSDINSFIKSILKNALPIADKSQPWYSVNNLAAKAIPDAVYKFVGINSDGTELPPEPIQEPVPQNPNSTKGGRKPTTYKIDGKEVSKEEYDNSPDQLYIKKTLKSEKEDFKARQEKISAAVKENPSLDPNNITMIAGEVVVPGKDLSKNQLGAIKMAKQMDNYKYPPEIESQYKKQIKAESEINKVEALKKRGFSEEEISKTPLSPLYDKVIKSELESPITKSSSTSSKELMIGGEPFIKGQSLSKIQMSAISLSKSMGNKNYPSEVEAQYKKQVDASNLVVDQPQNKRAVELGSAMSVARNESEQLKSQAEGAKSGGGGTNNISSNTVNNVSNSNTTVVRPSPSPGKRPSNVSELIWSTA
jgi:hypothetical protein